MEDYESLYAKIDMVLGRNPVRHKAVSLLANMAFGAVREAYAEGRVDARAELAHDLETALADLIKKNVI